MYVARPTSTGRSGRLRNTNWIAKHQRQTRFTSIFAQYTPQIPRPAMHTNASYQVTGNPSTHPTNLPMHTPNFPPPVSPGSLQATVPNSPRKAASLSRCSCVTSRWHVLRSRGKRFSTACSSAPSMSWSWSSHGCSGAGVFRGGVPWVPGILCSDPSSLCKPKRVFQTTK